MVKKNQEKRVKDQGTYRKKKMLGLNPNISAIILNVSRQRYSSLKARTLRLDFHTHTHTPLPQHDIHKRQRYNIKNQKLLTWPGIVFQAERRTYTKAQKWESSTDRKSIWWGTEIKKKHSLNWAGGVGLAPPHRGRPFILNDWKVLEEVHKTQSRISSCNTIDLSTNNKEASASKSTLVHLGNGTARVWNLRWG